MIKRKATKEVSIGAVKIGGDNPIAVQSMTKTLTSDIDATVRQIKSLESAGCGIIRLAVKDISDARALKAIKKEVSIPVVADIHFDHKLALLALESGASREVSCLRRQGG